MKPIKKLDYFIKVHGILSPISTSTTVNADSSSGARCLHYALTKYWLMVSLCIKGFASSLQACNHSSTMILTLLQALL